jgi:molecular chaperone GrpE (heat shock protein)
MKSKIKLTEQPRTVAIEKISNFPLLTIIWRTLQAEQKKINEAQTLARKNILELADGVIELKILMKNNKADDDNKEQMSKYLNSAYDKMSAALAKMKVIIITPENELFSADYMEVFESIAQVPDEEIDEPIIKEVVQPAIIYRDSLLKMGKAIIAVPVKKPEDNISDTNNKKRQHVTYKLNRR